VLSNSCSDCSSCYSLHSYIESFDPTDSQCRKYIRDVYVGEGELGVQITTSTGSPVISSVKPNSAVKGKICAGDFLVAINDMDVRHLKAAKIAKVFPKVEKSVDMVKLTVITDSDKADELL